MNFETKPLDLTSAALEKADLLVVLVGDGFKAKEAKGDGLAAATAEAIKSGDLSVKTGKSLHLYRPAHCAARRVVLAGVGDGRAAHVQQALLGVLSGLKTAPIKRLVVVDGDSAQPGWPAAAVRAITDAAYVYSHTKPQAEHASLQRVVLGMQAGSGSVAQFDLARAKAVALGVGLAKEWANRPANHATPTLLGQAAQELARFANIGCTVLGPRDIDKLKMGAFASVARGSDEPARFIVLTYSGAAKSQAPTVLIGKGITFDTGGISIKPSGEMDEMKFDMCGAASVIGTFRALAELQPRINVVGLIPACENMPDGRALKPGDVVTSMSGQTIEVLNTDAEGRLVLCDALTYAERFRPLAVVDIATLTGACVVALGGVRAGLFSNNAALADELIAAGESARDLCWPMPLDDDYADLLKTNFADVANIGGRTAGAVTAAKFLQRFADKFAWAHLDIAGVAWKGGTAKGATGRPVGLLVDFLMARAGRTVDAEASPPPKRRNRRSSALPS